jgi:hypothetical protein
MMLRLTAKALALLGNERATLTTSQADDEDWYLNLVWVDGRKCLLLTHAATLFSVFAADVRVSDLRPIGRFVAQLIKAELRSEALPDDCFGALDPDHVQIGKTADRSVLGVMNDLAFLVKATVADAGGLYDCNISDLNRSLRRGIYNRTGYVTAMDLVAARLANRRGVRYHAPDSL